MTNYFTHTRLSSARSTRVLRLTPSADFDSPIHCELHEISLDDKIKYEALSYVWGEPAAGHTVCVNGDRTLDVTPNCLEALRYLRRQGDTATARVLWIDAICIDQSKDSVLERNQQVALMGDVYSAAAGVLIWLGPGQPSTPLFSRRLRFLSFLRYASKESRFWRARIVAKLVHKQLTKAAIVPRPNNKTLTQFAPAYRASIVPMLRHPWWCRVWTMQEQLLGSRCSFLCGRSSIPMLDFMWFLTLDYSASVEAAGPGFFSMHFPRIHIPSSLASRGWHGTNTVGQLLIAAFNLDATFVLDKIYGLHSALKRCGLPLADPDYSKTPRVLWEEVAVAWILGMRNLGILQLAARPPSFEADYPSWVPPWHTKIDQSSHACLAPGAAKNGTAYRPYLNFSWYHQQEAGRPLSQTQQCNLPLPGVHTPGRLQLQGWRCGKLRHTWSLWDALKSLDVVEMVRTQREYCLHVYHLHRKDGEERLCAEIMEMGHTFSKAATSAMVQKEKLPCFLSWFDVMIFPECRTGVTWTNELADQLSLQGEEFALFVNVNSGNWKFQDRHLARSLDDFDWSRQKIFGGVHMAFCILDNGIMAYANHWVHSGDEVFLFPHSPDPLVLRKEGDAYRLVGMAGVHRLEDLPGGTNFLNGDWVDMLEVTLI